ncbi:MAG TPA: DsbA family oxidoreductase [Cellulomonas sp.]
MTTAPTTRLRVDVWADVVCPWCYVGAARLTRAIDAMGLSGSVDLVPRAFELDPTTPTTPQPLLEHLAHKFGGLLSGSSAMAEQVRGMEERVRDLAVAEGLPFEVDRVTANTRDAHRVTALATSHGLGMAYFEALQRAYFAGASTDPFGRAALLATAGEVGLPGAEVERVLDSDEFADEVARDQAQAAEIGVQGVPFVVVDGRYGVSGAREPEVYREVLSAGLDRAE